MTGKELYQGLSQIDEDLIAEAAEAPDRRRHILRSALLTAACLCALLAVSAGAVWKLGSIGFHGFYAGSGESGYQVIGEAEPVPETALSAQVEEALQEIRQQWQDYTPTDSWYPAHWRKDLDTWQECEDFLGFPLENPLEEQAWLEYGDHSGLPLDWELLEGDGRHCEVNLLGSEEQELTGGWVAAGYMAGEIRLSIAVNFYTGQEQMETGSVWSEQMAFSREAYQMSDGREAILVIAEPEREEEAYVSADAYFVQGYGLYVLHAVAPAGTGDRTAVRQVIERALSCF